MSRAIGVVLAGALMVGVLLDPYTFSKTASDFVEPGPWWQMALGLLDAALLAWIAVLLTRRRALAAFWVAGTELVYALSLGIVFVARDGVSRFVAGFGAEEYLTLYLASIGLRVVLLLLTQTLRMSARGATVTG
jgi:hypothetical protein